VAGQVLARYRSDGRDGLLDRSSAPAVVANRTDERRIEVIAALRRLRMTGAEIADCLDMAVSTVSGILTRIGMGKLGRIGLEPAQRYGRQRPGELLHIDVKKLGRIQGGAGKRHTGGIKRNPKRTRVDAAGVQRKVIDWEYVHIAIDDVTRLAYVEVLADEKATAAVGFLRRAVAHYAAHGVRIETLMTDNGGAYTATVHATPAGCSASGTSAPALSPPDQRQAERFIRTLLAGWAYGAIYRSSHERNPAFAGWLDWYNTRRPHGALSHKPPIARLNELNNLLG
jgi:transposase InsO family protein